MLIQVAIDGLLMGCVYSLNAVGLSLMFGVVGLVNFAYSDVMMIGMYTCYWLAVFLALDPIFSFPFAIIVCAILGWFTYTVIIRKVMKAPVLAQTMSTFAFAIVLRNLAVFFFTQNYRVIKNPIVAGQFYLGSLSISMPKLFACIASVITFFVLWWFLTKTKTGLGLRATSIDKTAASLMGINTNRMFAIAYVVGCACAGVAAAALSNFYYIYPYVGATFSTITFATVALGGFGSLPGALIGGLIIGLVESVAGFYLDPSLKYACVFLVYISVIVARPKGLMGW